MKEVDFCCICGKKFTNYGNNAMPVKEGRCCDDCNWEYVIPKRMELYKKSLLLMGSISSH